MKKGIFLATLFISLALHAQQASVDVSLNPAGSFKGKTSDVKGFATKKDLHDIPLAHDTNVLSNRASHPMWPLFR